MYLFKITQLSFHLTTLDELRARCHPECQRSIFGAKLTAWRHKIFHIFHFLPFDMVFEIASPFLCIFNAISSEKRLDFSAFPDLLTWCQDTKMFSARWMLIGQFKFPACQPYARLLLTGEFSIQCNTTNLTKRSHFFPSIAQQTQTFLN